MDVHFNQYQRKSIKWNKTFLQSHTDVHPNQRPILKVENPAWQSHKDARPIHLPIERSQTWRTKTNIISKYKYKQMIANFGRYLQQIYANNNKYWQNQSNLENIGKREENIINKYQQMLANISSYHQIFIYQISNHCFIGTPESCNLYS